MENTNIKKVRVKRYGADFDAYECTCNECGHVSTVVATATKHFCLECGKAKRGDHIIFKPEWIL